MKPDRLHAPGVAANAPSPAALEACDLAILLVDHSAFEPEIICRHAPLVFDTKGTLRGQMRDGETL